MRQILGKRKTMSASDKPERVDKLMEQIDDDLNELFSLHRDVLKNIMEQESCFVQLATKVYLARDADELEGELLEDIEYELEEIGDALDYYGEALSGY